MTTPQNKFTLEDINEAAYLDGVCHIKCIGVEPHPTKQKTMVFVFDLTVEEARKKLGQFFGSQENHFCDAQRRLKDWLFHRMTELGYVRSRNNPFQR